MFKLTSPWEGNLTWLKAWVPDSPYLSLKLNSIICQLCDQKVNISEPLFLYLQNGHKDKNKKTSLYFLGKIK